MAPSLSRAKEELAAGPTFIDTAHERISTSLLRLSNQIDSFFGDERMDEETNKTRMRIYTQTDFAEGEPPVSENAFRVQLRLPRTERRLQLVVQNNDRDDESDVSNQASRASQTRAKDNASGTASAGLRYLLDKADIKFTTDMGIRLNWPPKIFARARLRKTIGIGDKWIFRPVERLMWVDREGWSSAADLNFDRKIDDTWLFRYANLVEWNDREFITRWQSGPIWFHKISEKTGISYSALSFWSDGDKTWAVDRYALAAGFRQLIYKQWFFWEATPVLSFPRERNFRRQPGFSVRVEAIFGRI